MRSVSLWSLVALLAVLLLGPTAAAQESPRPPYLGMPLAEALVDMQGRGLKIIYSSDLVKPGMRVRSEPEASSLHLVLEEILAPHGLKAEVGPRGAVLVVLRDPAPILVAIEQPSPFRSVFGSTTVKALVMTEELVDRVDFFLNDELMGSVRRPPYHLEFPVGDGNHDRQFRVEARGAWGGFGEASVITRRVEIEDQFQVALKQLFVTVDQGSRRVHDLKREDFSVFDGGKRQELVTFERGDVPITAVVLMDASESMKGRYLESALTGSRAFLRTMNRLDEAMVMLFADRPLAVTPFLGDAAALAKGLDRVFARGGTALNDHLYASLRLLDRTQGRRVVVLLSDGADVLSALRIEDVLWKVRRSDALIYWIQLQNNVSEFSSAWRDPSANRKEWEGLESAVRESGGAIRRLEDIEEIQPAFEEIMAELRGQYVLGYYPSVLKSDGSWRPVRVKVDLRGAKVRFRAGYIDN